MSDTPEHRLFGCLVWIAALLASVTLGAFTEWKFALAALLVWFCGMALAAWMEIK